MFGGMDDIFGNMDRMMSNMNNMMNGMMGGGMMGGGMMGGGLMGPSPFGLMNSHMNSQMQLMQNPHRMGGQLSMLGGPSNMSMMSFSNMPGQSVSYSSKVMTFSSDGSGKPQVYEQTSSQVCGPNGIRETKETVRDSRTGVQQIKVGRHINDRGHLKQKKRNVYTNDEEEEEELVNLDEEEIDQFNNEYVAKSRDFRQKYQSIGQGQGHGHGHGPTGRQRLALTNGPSASQTASYPPPPPAPAYSSHVPSYPQASSSNPQYYNLAQEQDTRPPSRGKSRVKFEQNVTDKKSSSKKKPSKKPY